MVMVSKYDAILDEEQGSAPATGPSSYDTVLDQEVQMQQRAARTVFEKALAVNPDQAASSKKLMTTTGLPLAVVERNLDEVKRKDQARMLDLAQMAQDSPVLARQIMDPSFTNQAHDDVSTLGSLEQFLRDTGGSMKAGVFNASKGAAGLFRAGAELIAPILDPLAGTILPENPLRRVAAGFAEMGAGAGAIAKAATPTTTGVLSGGFQSGVQSLTQNLLTLPAAFLPGGQAAALTGMVGFTGGQSYQDAREKGLSMSQALPFAASQAAIEYATEKMPLEQLIGGIKAGAPLLQTIAKQMALEIPGEQVATILQDLNEWAVLNPEKTFRSYLEERPNAAAQTLIATIVGTGGNILVAKGVEAATKRLMGDAYDAGQADTHAAQLQDAFKNALDSKLRERNPDDFRTLIQKMADNTDGAPKEVYVDAEVLNQLAPELIAQLPESVRAALPDALAANDVVAIPVGDVLTVAPGTPMEQMLVEHARIGDVRAMSQFEAKEAGAKAQEFLAQESQRVIQQAVDQRATQESHDRVKQTLLDQLNSVGRNRTAVNETTATLYASLYTTLAGQLGITPEAAFALHGVNVTGKTGQGGVLNTGGMAGEMSVEGYHFSAADRTTLSTAMYGTGLKGSARDEIMNHPDQRLKERLSFYFDKGTGIRPESGVGGRAHRVQLSGVYDADADPLKLRTGNARELESKLLDLGYKGYANRMDGTQPGQVIMLGAQNFQPELLGALSQITTGQRVAPIAAAAPQWQTQASGEPAMLAAKLERMQAMPAWAGYDLRIEGRELQSMQRQDTYAQQSQALQTEIEQAGGKVNDILQVDQLISSEEIPTITLQDLIGLDIFPTIADRTAAAAVYSGIDSSRLDVAIPLLGGPLFPLRETNVEAGVVWANRGKGVTSQKAAKLKAGANYMMVLLGDADMHQSNSTVAAAVMGTLEAWQRDGRLGVEHVEALAELVRTAPSADTVVKSYLENFPGFDDAAIMHAYMDGMSFNARKRVIELLASKEAMVLGAPPMNLILDATREPSMAGHRWGDGVILLEVDQTNTQVELGTEGTTAHPDFPVGIRGRVVGKLNAPISWQVLWQDWLNANNGASPRRAFELSKPVVTVTQELIDRIGPINQTNIDSARQARLAADFAADNWRQTGVPVKQGGASPQEFVDAILTTAARPVLTEYSLDQVKQGAKDGSFKVFQLGADGRIFFGMKYGDPGYAADYGINIPEITANEVALVSVVNNEQGARGIGAPAVVLKALQEGATVLDCFAVKNEKFTDGFLPEIYAAFGFEKVAEIPFAPEYYSAQKLADAVKFWKDTTPGFDPATNGYPPLVIMKWKGTDADRTDIINRYLRDGVAGVLARGASESSTANADRVLSSVGAEGAAQGGTSDAQRDPGNQGDSAGARIASRARGTVQGIAGLNDGELRNLGLTVADRTAVQRGLGAPVTDNAPAVAQAPAGPETLEQGPRGTFNPKTFELALNEGSNMSTVHHEMGHAYLEIITKIASEPGAPQGIIDQVERFLKWQGVADLATWQAMTLDQKRPHHEALAESYEHYLLTGKAPSLELQPLFRKLKAYMLNAYKTLKAFFEANPNVAQKLPPEMVQFYDRMLASEEQIAQAEEVAGLLPEQDATAEAVEKLTARSLRDLKWTVNARNREIKKLQAQAKALRKGIETEVTAEVNAMPEFQAKEMLDKTRKENKEQLNDTELAIVADAFQYASVEEMLRAIDGAGKKADVIEGMTDQRMLEEHGDLIDQRAVEAAANEAVHNEARARSLATELRSQAEMLNPRTDTGEVNAKGSKITVNAIVEAAKQFAANVVARTPLKDLKAKAWQHTAAERRAGKRWTEATAAGKTQDAVKAKQDQVLNNAAAKAALDAQTEMRKILEFFKRVIKDNNEKVVDKGRDPDVVNAARAVLAAYGVAPKAGKTALEYMDLVEKNDPAMFAALQPSVQGALNMAQPLDALTMDELRALHEEIQGMWHLAKRSRQMEIDGNMLDMQDAEDELQARMQVLGVPLTMPGDSGAVTKAEERVRKLQGVRALLRRVEQWAEGMGKPFTRLVFQPIKDAADAYRADRTVYRKKYQALVDKVAPALTKGLIEAPELGYTFGKGHNGIGHAELLHAILHTGNESNKRKLLLGRGWALENADGTLNTDRWDAFLKRAHDTGLLNKAHYDFAQGVWDLLEETKPLAQKTHRDVFGRYFAEVTADSFTTPFGDYAGGYVPAQADPRIVQDADLRKLTESENENMSFSFPSTSKGFTKGRVEYNRPLLLDLRTIGQHLDKVLLFSHMEPAVRDVNKLLSRKGVAYSLGRIDPAAYSGMLTPWLNRSARQVVETPVVGDGGISRVLSAARGRAGMALMFANVSNTIQQLTGFSTAAIKVKPASMMAATAQFISGPKKMAQAVSEASVFMAGRMDNEISAINDAMDAILLDPNLYEKAQAWSQKHAYFMQTAMANTMEPIIWTGAYNDALERGDSERDAVRFADSVIRTTQGSTLPEDVSRIETGPAYARIFTQFIGYFNMMANTNATALQQISQEIGLKKGAGKAIGVVTLGLLIPLWVAEAIAQAMRGGPDDPDKDGYLDDWLAAVFGMGTIKGTLAMVPFIGQLANAGINRFNGNPADDKVSLSPAVSLLESAVGVPVDVYKAITGDVNKRNMVRDVASAVSLATGLPAIAIARPLGYLAGVEDGKIKPTGPVDATRGAITGTPSPASK
jgi:hypothetical protein